MSLEATSSRPPSTVDVPPPIVPCDTRGCTRPAGVTAFPGRGTPRLAASRPLAEPWRGSTGDACSATTLTYHPCLRVAVLCPRSLVDTEPVLDHTPHDNMLSRYSKALSRLLLQQAHHPSSPDGSRSPAGAPPFPQRVWITPYLKHARLRRHNRCRCVLGERPWTALVGTASLWQSAVTGGPWLALKLSSRYAWLRSRPRTGLCGG
jgi:hypothetical protein